MNRVCAGKKTYEAGIMGNEKAMILKDAEAFKVYRQVYEFLTNELGMENI